jgi:hypothetical protein
MGGARAGADDPGLAVLRRRGAGTGPHLLDAVLDAIRLGPDDDEAEVTAAQVHEVITRLHPRLTHRSAWLDHDGPLPVIEGILIRLQVDQLPGDRDPRPLWLWPSAAGAALTRWPGCGRRSCAGSTWSTHSGCSSRSSARPPRRSATRMLRTGGLG